MSEGLEAHRARRFDDALWSFDTVLAAVPGDGPLIAMLKRAQAMQADPPASGRDGHLGLWKGIRLNPLCKRRRTWQKERYQGSHSGRAPQESAFSNMLLISRPFLQSRPYRRRGTAFLSVSHAPGLDRESGDRARL